MSTSDSWCFYLLTQCSSALSAALRRFLNLPQTLSGYHSKATGLTDTYTAADDSAAASPAHVIVTRLGCAVSKGSDEDIACRGVPSRLHV
jgi:hypothetical protein